MDACLILLHKHFVVVSAFIGLIQSVPRAKDTSEQIGLFFVFILENIYSLTLDSQQRPKDDERKNNEKPPSIKECIGGSAKVGIQ